MRRLAISLILALLAFPSDALAQWWLFPGSRQKKDTTAVKATVPVSDSIPPASMTLHAEDSIVFQELPAEEEPDVIKAALVLPFKSEDTPNGNFLDFYSGVLMAVQELAEIGRRVDLTVEDCTSESFVERCRKLADVPIIIGPVNMADINRCIAILPDKWFISPLEPKAEDFAGWCHVIQTPTPYRCQVKELVSWLKADARRGDRIVLLQDDNPESFFSDQSVELEMNEQGVKYEISNSPEQNASPLGSTTRFILVSDDGNYAADKVREIALMKLNSQDVVLYSTSKIRNISSIESGNLHLAQTHITLNYHADASSADVRTFIERYKSRFHIAPGMFAFHGYDTAKYFISMYERYGNEWLDGLHHAKWTGLQSDFNFNADKKLTGKLNTSVRRIVYKSDGTITLVK